LDISGGMNFHFQFLFLYWQFSYQMRDAERAIFIN
jgi:hypothetical protein